MDPLKLSLKAVFFTSFCTFCLILLYLPHVLYAEEASFTSGDSLADYYEDDPLNQDYYEDDFISDVDDGADGSHQKEPEPRFFFVAKRDEAGCQKQRTFDLQNPAENINYDAIIHARMSSSEVILSLLSASSTTPSPTSIVSLPVGVKSLPSR